MKIKITVEMSAGNINGTAIEHKEVELVLRAAINGIMNHSKYMGRVEQITDNYEQLYGQILKTKILTLVDEEKKVEI